MPANWRASLCAFRNIFAAFNQFLRNLLYFVEIFRDAVSKRQIPFTQSSGILDNLIALFKSSVIHEPFSHISPIPERRLAFYALYRAREVAASALTVFEQRHCLARQVCQFPRYRLSPQEPSRRIQQLHRYRLIQYCRPQMR